MDSSMYDSQGFYTFDFTDDSKHYSSVNYNFTNQEHRFKASKPMEVGQSYLEGFKIKQA